MNTVGSGYYTVALLCPTVYHMMPSDLDVGTN